MLDEMDKVWGVYDLSNFIVFGQIFKDDSLRELDKFRLFSNPFNEKFYKKYKHFSFLYCCFSEFIGCLALFMIVVITHKVMK